MNRPIQFPPLPLESGDHLSREEFERRYEAMPQLKKAELIEGVVYMPSPVRWNHHGSPHANLVTWLGFFKAHTPGVSLGDNVSVRMDLGNLPQPDGALIIEPDCGGQVQLSEDDYVEGGPEFLAEIAASSVSMDLNKKLHVYQRNKVQEYLVWRVQDQVIDWFVLKQERFEPLVPNVAEIYQSCVFPGLWLDAQAMVRGDLLKVLEVLQQGIASKEHRDFVEKLRSRKKG
jgi:hypothetical protein